MDSKKVFGQRLQALMLDLGWNQSELGRRCNINRDLISGYIRGKFWPSQTNMAQLRSGLGQKNFDKLRIDTLPDPMTLRAIGSVGEEFSVTFDKEPGKAHIKINQVIDADLALRLMAFINEHNNKGKK